MKKKINSYKNKPLAKQIEHKPNENKVRSWDNRLDVFKQNKAQKKMKHSSDWKKNEKVMHIFNQINKILDDYLKVKVYFSKVKKY